MSMLKNMKLIRGSNFCLQELIEKTGLAEAQIRGVSDTHARLTRKVESLEHRIVRMRSKV